MNKWQPWRSWTAACLAVLLLVGSWPWIGLAAANAEARSTLAYVTGHWAQEEIEDWVRRGYASGTGAGRFEPDRPVTRAEWLKMVNRVLSLQAAAGGGRYPDVSPDAWYATEVATAVSAGYISGYADGRLLPDAPVTRQEAAVMMGRIGAAQLAQAVGGSRVAVFADETAAWSGQSVTAVASAGWMKGYPDGTFGPNRPMTRAEAVVTLNRMAQSVFGRQSDEGDVVYGEPGIYGPSLGISVIRGDAAIRISGVTLQNVAVAGNLEIVPSGGKGAVRLQGVSVTGEANISGGGTDGIYLHNSVLKQLIVEETGAPVNLIASGSSAIARSVVHGSAALTEEDLSGSGFADVLVSSEFSRGDKVSLSGEFAKVDIEGSQLRTNLETGSIRELRVPVTAQGVHIHLEKDTVVHEAFLHSGVTVTGQGIIKKGALPGPSGGNSAGSGVPQTPGPAPGPGPEPQPGPDPEPEPEPTVTGIVYAPDSLSFTELGADIVVTLRASLSDGSSREVTGQAEWRSDDENVAVANAGRITPVGNGATVIRVTYGEFSGEIPVTVSVASVPSVTGYVYDPERLVFSSLNSRLPIKLTEIWSDGTIRDVTAEAVWSSEEPAIASVDGQGVVTSNGDGSTYIGVAYGSYSARIPVLVAVPGADEVQAIAATDRPVAGGRNTVRLSVKRVDGRTDTGFSGSKQVTVSDVSQAPGGSFGVWDGTEITDGSAVRSVSFHQGEAEIPLVLHHAASQAITIAVEGVGGSAPLSIHPQPAEAAQLELAVQPEGAVSGKPLTRQPVVHLRDAYGNLSASQVAVSASVSSGSSVLTGAGSIQAADGVAAFTDLVLTGEAAGVVMTFRAGTLSLDSLPIDVLPPFSGGKGTDADPYRIATAEQLNYMRNYLDASFVLENDIDLANTPYSQGEGWLPIGIQGKPFTGRLDGNGNTIRNLYINRLALGMDQSLLGVTDHADITNLALSGVDVKGDFNAASLISTMNGGTVVNVHVNGKVEGKMMYAGGLVARSTGQIMRASAHIEVVGFEGVGGLVGVNDTGGMISESFAKGSVMSNFFSLGGLVGSNYGAIQNSYANVQVTGGTRGVGGLVGTNNGPMIHLSYSVGQVSSGAMERGGLIGTMQGGPVLFSYYDRETSGQNETGKGEAKATAEMKTQGTFTGWDFTNVWELKPGEYPSLRWQNNVTLP